MPNKWALVTGVSEGGVGDALLQELMGRDINVVATALQLDMLDYLQDQTNVKLEKLQLDVADAHSIAAAAEQTSRITNGRLDYLFNVAGYGYMMPLIDADLDSVRKNFEVNVFGILALTQAIFPLLREAKGMVVNQSSISGLAGTYEPFIGTYGATKAALNYFSNTMRVELAPFDVKVVTLITGDVKTRFWDNIRGGRVGLPPSSPYQPIKAKAEAMMRGETNPHGQHTRERWAKEVVRDLHRSANPPSHIKRGFLAQTMWIVSLLFPFWTLDWAYKKAADLDKLKAMLDSNQHYESKKLQ